MTLEQLRIFVAVAEAEHVTRAAKILRLTQSAVSAAVAGLEGRYSLALFHRVGRRIELTEEGRTFLGEARAVLSRAAAAEQALADMSGLKFGTLKLRASQTIASYWLPPRLIAFHNAHPEITLDVTIGNTAQVVGAVLNGEAELGFIEGHVENPLLEQQIVETDRMVVLVAPWHSLAKKRRPTDRDLIDAKWILREPGSGTRSEFEAAMAARGIETGCLDVSLELPSNEAVRAAVEAGAGATALSELVARSGLEAGRLVRVRVVLPERPFQVVRHRQRYSSKAASKFLDGVGR